MGDIVHALPAAIFLRCNFPEATINWLVEERWAEMFGSLPFIDGVHRVDTRRWRKNVLASRKDILSTLREIRAKQYNVAIDFQGAIKSAMFALLSGATRRYGFADTWEKPASMFYTRTCHTESSHVVQQNCELAEEMVSKERGLIDKDIPSLVHEPGELKRWANAKIEALQLTSRFVILNPGAGWGAKQWPVERYAEIARELGTEGFRSLVNYGPGEEELARHVEQNSNGHAIAANFTVSQLMAITQQAALFIGGDTGPVHLAAFLNIPVVAIFGPTDPARNGPYGTSSVVFRDSASVTSHKRRREAEAGLLNITAAEVIQAARELLQINSTGVRA
jgi:heptosyltransferase-1